MKKLLFLLMILFSTPCFAGTISLNTISNDSTAQTHNSNFTTIANLANGAIEGSCDGGSTPCNIDNDTIYEVNMADDANPRVREAELLGIGVDSVSGGTLTQNAVVESGCVPADDTDLTSDISACVAYVNGYRVSKGATSNTYTASRDCYVDLSQSAVYTTTCVANGATQPSVAANSVRLAKVVTNGTEITTITSLYTTRIPGLIIPANYRDSMIVSYDSTTTLIVTPGSAEINNSMITKTSNTTLTISTAGDYAGGVSLRATNTTGFVGIDSSGNIKMHTTAPTNSDYAVSVTAGKKRYATWSGTVYRILGWFRMNGTGSGELDVWGVGNIKEYGVANSVIKRISADATTTSATYESMGSGADQTIINFYSSGGKIKSHFKGTVDTVGATNQVGVGIEVDGVLQAAQKCGGASAEDCIPVVDWMSPNFQGSKNVEVKWARVQSGGDTMTQLGGQGFPRTLIVEEE